MELKEICTTGRSRFYPNIKNSLRTGSISKEQLTNPPENAFIQDFVERPKINFAYMPLSAAEEHEAAVDSFKFEIMKESERCYSIGLELLNADKSTPFGFVRNENVQKSGLFRTQRR